MPTTDPSVRTGDPDDLLAVMRVLDAGMLSVGVETVRERLRTGDVLVADLDGRLVGALVLDDASGPRDATATDGAGGERGAHVRAVAVRHGRRGRGVGTALVEAALRRRGRLTADCDPSLRPFYEALGFDLEARDGRLWGELVPEE